MASTPSSSERGRRLSRAGGGGLRRGRGNAAPSVDLHALAVAYALDALDERQRDAFAAHLPDCPTCQATLDIAPGPIAALTVAATPVAPTPPTLAGTLRAVVIDVLPQTSQVEVAWRPAPLVGVGEADPRDEHPAAPASGTAAWMDAPLPARQAPAPMTPAGAGAVTAPSWDAWAHRGPAASDGTTETDAAGRIATDSEGRPRPGLPPGMTGGWPTGANAEDRPARAIGTAPWAAAAVVALVAVALLVWGFRERSAIGDVEAELAAQRTAVADIRANANASSFTMVPTEVGPAAATGTAFFALPAMRGALTLAGMPSLPDGEAYQLWFVAPDGSAAAGPAARPDAQGVVVVAFDATGLQVERLYVTISPPTGSATADFDRFPPLLLGILGGATR